MAPPTVPSFPQELATLNGLDDLGFAAWCLDPGMGFGEPALWWGPKRPRRHAHEGLDFRLYLTREREVKAMRAGALIPAAWAGEVLAVHTDFLGKTVWLRHAFRQAPGEVFLSAYGHLRPVPGVEAGAEVQAGEILGTVAGRPELPEGPLPHLHVSFAWAPEAVAPEDLAWTVVNDRHTVRFLDPLPLLSGGDRKIFSPCYNAP